MTTRRSELCPAFRASAAGAPSTSCCAAWPAITFTELLLRPAGAPLRYQPGQYVLLGDPGAELVVRSCSIANAPRRDGLISLLVTRVPGGQVSTWIHDVLRPIAAGAGVPIDKADTTFFTITMMKTIGGADHG